MRRIFILFIFFPVILFGANLSPTIVLDAGHGGPDLGARGKKPYCEEKKITLQTSLLLKKYLTRLGYRVVMTRSNDVFIPLQRRVEIANKASSNLFISIHFNSCDHPSAQGIEVFFYDSLKNKKRATCSRTLAQLVLDKLTWRTSASSRGVKKGNFHVIRETDMPAILVEGGFLSNPKELVLLKNADYLEKIARGVAEGIDQYCKKKI